MQNPQPEPLSTLGTHYAWVEANDSLNAPWLARCSCGWKLATNGDNVAEYLINAHVQSYAQAPVTTPAVHQLQLELLTGMWQYHTICNCGFEHYGSEKWQSDRAMREHLTGPDMEGQINT